MRKFLTFRFKIIILALLVATVPISVYQYFGIQRTSELLTRTVAEDLESRTGLVVHEINSFLQHKIDDAKVVAGSDLLRSRDIEEVSRFLSDVRAADPDIADLDFVDMHGLIIACSFEADEENMAGMSYLEEHAGLEDLFASASTAERGDIIVAFLPHYDEYGGIVFAAPVMSEDESSKVGLLFLVVDMVSIEKTLSDFLGGEFVGKAVYLVTNDGKVVSTPDHSFDVLEEFPDWKISEELRSGLSIPGGKGNTRYTNSLGVEVLAGYADLGRFGANQALDWKLVAVSSVDRILAPAHEAYDLLLTFGIIVTLVGVLAAFLMASKIVRPLKKLVSMAERIGKDNDAGRLPTNLDGEMGRIALAVNEMADRVEQRTNDLVHKNSELHNEVEARKTTENHLRENRELLTATLEATADGIYVGDCQGRTLMRNRQFDEIWRIPEDILQSGDLQAMIDHVLDQVVDPEQFQNRIIELYRSEEESKDTLSFKDGRIIERLSRPLFEGGEMFGRVWSFRDVTEQRQRDLQLRESQQRLSIHVDRTPVGFIEWDLDFRVREWNPAAERIFGFSRQEAMGRHPAGFILPDNLKEVIDEVWQGLLTKEGGEHSVNENLTKDGKTITCEWYNTPLVDCDGNVIGAASLLEDITDRLRSEEVLKESEGRFRALTESNSDLTIVIDESWKVTYVSPSISRITSHSVDETLGGGLELFVLPDDLQMLKEFINVSSAEIGKNIVLPDFRVKHADGRWLHMEGSATALPEVPGVNGTVLNCRDITDRKIAEAGLISFADKLEQSNRELQEFAAVASHDLQEPLRKVMAFGDRLRKVLDGQLSEQADDYLTRMQSAAHRMQTLINDLLQLSRVSSRARPFEKVDMNQVVAEVLSDLEVLIEQTNAVVTVEKLPAIEADPTQMRQLLQNLLSNALKFHKPDEPAQVRISCVSREEVSDTGKIFGQSRERVELRIADNGIGFDEKYKEKIFNVFQRLHGRTEYEGTGIGLAVCKKIVSRHDGQITSRSTPDQGAEFIISLPMTQRTEEFAYATVGTKTDHHPAG